MGWQDAVDAVPKLDELALARSITVSDSAWGLPATGKAR
jgi:hypothetical protein